MSVLQCVRVEELPYIGSSRQFTGAEHGQVGISIYFVQAQPGLGAPLHIHAYDEVVLVHDGISRLVVGSGVQECGPGDIVIIKAGTPHGFLNIGSGILSQVDIHLSPRFEQQVVAPTEVSRSAGLPDVEQLDLGQDTCF